MKKLIILIVLFSISLIVDAQISTKEMPIGSWDMDESDFVNIDLDMPDSVTVIKIEASIYNDLEMQQYQFPYHKQGVVNGGIQGWVSIYAIGADVVLLERLFQGDFDSSDFDDPYINRGWIIVTYKE